MKHSPKRHFIVVFCQFRQKPGFLIQNVSQKGIQWPFWLSLHYVTKPSKFWAALPIFLQLLWVIHRAPELVPRKSLTNTKNHIFATFLTKIALLSLKTGAKALIDLQQGETSLTQRFPIKKYTIEKKINLQKTDSSGLKACPFAVFFLNIQTSQRKTSWTVGNVSACSNCPLKTLFLARLHEKWENGKGESEALVLLIFNANGVWRVFHLNTSYMAQNAEIGFKTHVTTCVTVFGKIPCENGKTPKYNSISSK